MKRHETHASFTGRRRQRWFPILCRIQSGLPPPPPFPALVPFPTPPSTLLHRSLCKPTTMKSASSTACVSAFTTIFTNEHGLSPRIFCICLCYVSVMENTENRCRCLNCRASLTKGIVTPGPCTIRVLVVIYLYQAFAVHISNDVCAFKPRMTLWPCSVWSWMTVQRCCVCLCSAASAGVVCARACIVIAEQSSVQKGTLS